MTSFNRIGEVWAGGDYRLNTTVLREEWGFKGYVICDFNTCSHMNCKDMFYSGNDLNLESAGLRVWKIDEGNANDVTIARKCAKNIIYVITRSYHFSCKNRHIFRNDKATWRFIGGTAGKSHVHRTA